MKINLKQIPEDGEELRGTEPPAIMELTEPDVRFEKEIAYELHAQMQADAVLVTGRLEAPVTLRCSRCLKLFEQRLLVRQFVFHQENPGGDFVDLTANIREDIILELPQRALCGPDCKGLCPVCGKNWNEGSCRCAPPVGDLRWHALDQIKLGKRR